MICDRCGKYYTKEQVFIDANGTVLCPDCAEDYVFCANCGCFSTDYYSYGEDYYCRDCYYDLDLLIEDCDTDVEYIFFGCPADSSFYGVEWEIDTNACVCPEDCAETMFLNSTEVFFKEDGSLTDCGFEVISHPCSLKYHMEQLPWEKLCQIALDAGYAPDHPYCGLHVHVDRRALGDTETERELTIAKLMLFMDKFWDDYIVPFSRRDIERLNQWAAKPSAPILPDDTIEAAIEKSKRDEHEKSAAINLEHDETIEFRIFKSTLDYRVILATLQWVDILIHKCKLLKLQDFASLTWEDVFGGCEYEELNNYLKDIF